MIAKAVQPKLEINTLTSQFTEWLNYNLKTEETCKGIYWFKKSSQQIESNQLIIQLKIDIKICNRKNLIKCHLINNQLNVDFQKDQRKQLSEYQIKLMIQETNYPTFRNLMEDQQVQLRNQKYQQIISNQR
ncbi:unnamed protein product [Paramecium sonneborni]|uniref:Uncharacterized protein n=1 Tax=Paramecium sonneborni TaxID=65129 RepID=A0A8S1RJG8_9CILI|nr:unnamed protein product [Paramecium sonneborni]